MDLTLKFVNIIRCLISINGMLTFYLALWINPVGEHSINESKVAVLHANYAWQGLSFKSVDESV